MSTIVQPALIIGLGGSGTDIVRRFKRRFRTTHADTPYVRFLGIDTAPQNPAREGLPPLTEDEFVWASEFNMQFYVGSNHIDQNPAIRAWWKGYDKLPMKFVQAGAGMKRPIGRLALFIKYDQVVGRIASQFQAILSDRIFFDLPDHYRRAVNIYLVSSTCGGTGTGMYLDIAYIAKHLATQRFGVDARVRAILLLPSAFTGTGQVNAQNTTNLQLNAYGALTELDYAMSKTASLADLPLPDGQHVQRGDEPFRSCYLVGNQVEQGALINDFEELQERAAVHLHTELASPLTETGAAVLDNVLMSIAVKPDAQGHRRMYSSFSGDWIELPGARVLARWTQRQALRTLDRLRRPMNAEHAASAQRQLGDAQGYGSLRSLFAGEGIAPYLPRVEGHLEAFMDVGTDGRAPQELIQAGQALEQEAQSQIRNNPQLVTSVQESLGTVVPEVERYARELMGQRSVGDARQFVTEVRKELSGWLARAQNEVSGAASGAWVINFSQQVNEARKGLLESKDKYATKQRELVIDAAEQARDEWKRAVRARIANVAQARVPAILFSLQELIDKLSALMNVLDAAAAGVQKTRFVAQTAGTSRASDAEIDESYDASGRPERLDGITLRALDLDLLKAQSPEAVARRVVDAAEQAVLQVAPEYLQTLSIPAGQIADRMNRLSPLAVFTAAWPASPYAKDVERVWLIGIPSSMSGQREAVIDRLETSIKPHVQVIPINDEDRVVITTQNHGFPLYALQEVSDCRRAFEAADPFQRLLCFVTPEPSIREWDITPAPPGDAMRWFALAMATGRIRRAGQEYVYSNGRNGSIEVGLGTSPDPVAARQAAKDAFLQGGYANEVRLGLQERLRSEGNQPLYDQLSKWVGQQEEYKRAGAYPDEFDRDIRAVQEYMKSIVPF